jgi:hypothetical protein
LSEIRNLEREDLPAVADLFQKTFRNARRKAPPSLAAYLAEVFLNHPWFDPEIASRVHVAAGKVTGFIGVFPGRFRFRTQVIRAAIAGSLMVADPVQDPLAGAKLLRSVVKGPQDISISETTNLVSQGLWEPLGGKVLPLLSLDWVRVLKPASTALSVVAEKLPEARIAAPLFRGGDWLGASLTKRSAPSNGRGPVLSAERGASAETFSHAVSQLTASLELGPDWTSEDLSWLVRHAELKERHGPVHRTVVRDRAGEPAGCYLYHGKPGGMARVLQVLARPRDTDAVVDILLGEARSAGLAALRGRITPQIVTPLLKRRCLFLHRASTVIHTADAELGRTAAGEGALITGLAGESWTRLVGGEFG